MKNIYKKYGDFLASDNVSFGIEKGKLVALLGPSGSGKTTLLRMIAGLENPNAGDIYIDRVRVNDIPASQRGIGFVFQNYALFRYMTVYDNIAFGLKVQKVDKKTIAKRVSELIELIGLKGIIRCYEHRCHSFSEMAEHLDVTEEFLSDALKYYRKKFGLCTVLDNYIIYFEPALSVMKRIE